MEPLERLLLRKRKATVDIDIDDYGFEFENSKSNGGQLVPEDTAFNSELYPHVCQGRTSSKKRKIEFAGCDFEFDAFNFKDIYSSNLTSVADDTSEQSVPKECEFNSSLDTSTASLHSTDQFEFKLQNVLREAKTLNNLITG